MAKKIEEMDFYELLNLRLDATEQEILKAYDLAVATYHPDALASYGVLSAEERGEMLDRIEKAFQTLGDAAARTGLRRAHPAQPPGVAATGLFPEIHG